MAHYDNFHSRLVGWAKVILPLFALGILSTLFLFAKSDDETGDIPYAEINELARDQRITMPSFSGIANDGSVISINAETAAPDKDDLSTLNVTSPQLVMDTPEGARMEITAGDGVVDTSNNIARLGGLARLDTSDGYRMETTELIADLTEGTVQSTGPLAIIAPFGELQAGLVTIKYDEEIGHQMHFTNGVTMMYDLKNKDGISSD